MIDRRLAWALVAGLGLISWQAACSAGQPAAAPIGVQSGSRGAELYTRYCSACHGGDGAGELTVAELFYPRIRDFSNGLFHLVSTDNGVPTDEDLIAVIRDGMPGSAMPPYRWMPDDDLQRLAAHVRHLAVEGLVSEIQTQAVLRGETITAEQARVEALRRMEPGRPIALGTAVAPTREVLHRGATLYVENCGACHGMDGKGRTAFTWPNLVNIPFARDLTAGILRGGSSTEAIEVRIRAGMPGSVMPPTNLEPEDTAALVAFLRTLIPEGAEERFVQRRRILPVQRVDAAPTAPEDPRWEGRNEVRIVLAPMWWREDSVTETFVSALHDGRTIALRLRWPDDTRDDRALGGLRSDGAALQFSTAAEPPVFGMGRPDHSVHIWHWKAFRPDDTLGLADFLESRAHAAGMADVPIYSPAPGVASPRREGEAMDVGGIPSLGHAGERGQSILVVPSWSEGEWQVVFSRSLTIDDGIAFDPGGEVLMAFAAWNGGAGDAGGQKSVSIWHTLRLQR